MKNKFRISVLLGILILGTACAKKPTDKNADKGEKPEASFAFIEATKDLPVKAGAQTISILDKKAVDPSLPTGQCVLNTKPSINDRAIKEGTRFQITEFHEGVVASAPSATSEKSKAKKGADLAPAAHRYQAKLESSNRNKYTLDCSFDAKLESVDDFLQELSKFSNGFAPVTDL